MDKKTNLQKPNQNTKELEQKVEATEDRDSKEKVYLCIIRSSEENRTEKRRYDKRDNV